MATLKLNSTTSVLEKSAREKKMSFFETGPGPGKYLLKTLVGANGHSLSHRIYPQYSIGHRLKSLFFSIRDPGPGPAVYDIPQGIVANNRFSSKKFSLLPRIPILGYERLDIPGPAAYSPVDIMQYNFPKAIMHSRTKPIKQDITPGPAAYLLPPAFGCKIFTSVMPNGPCISLKSRTKIPDKSQSPGQFYVLPSSLNRKGFTIKGRYPDKFRSDGPGPAAYKIEPKQRIQFHYGRRHKEFTGIMRTPCDNV